MLDLEKDFKRPYKLALVKDDFLDPAVCDDLVIKFNNIPAPHWVTRKSFVAGRARYDNNCSYKCCLNKTIPKDLIPELLSIAPKLPNAKVAELVINKYEVGDYLPLHLDRTAYKYNCVIQLSQNGDGIHIEDNFHEDKKGSLLIFESVGHWHEVRPVDHLRYVLIYLYDFN